ncbi:Hypothetical predicted protein [Mytilus galloprovincialis]|uniref:Uncharacterized protein n=1 Tax=Mytilus galloprovincialis TaxID=29158 RepID=A0A8B6F9C2_MYTGA|nr:Hypothetical predicted protein [Mytilus galloprovincialis]
MPKLSRHMACRLPEYCTGATCCVDIPLLRTSVETFVLLDVCNYKITFGIERMIKKISLFDYNYNTWQNVTLGNVVRLGYKIEELSAEKMFLFNMKIDICFEISGDCRYSFIVLKNAKLPRQPCSWSGGHVIPGFNLNQWLSDKNLPSTTTVLNSLQASHLLEDLGLADYMLYPSCDFSTFQMRQPVDRGWKSECSSKVELPILPKEVVCHLDSTCNGITCCIEIKLLQKNINVFMDIDSCNYRVSIGIEKYQFHFSFGDFQFGVQQNIHISKVIEIIYKVTDFPGESVYFIDFNIRICFNDKGLCVIDTDVLYNTKVLKKRCDWSRGYKNKDWSLKNWRKDQGIGLTRKLSSETTLLLLDKLGIAEFLLDDQCDRHDHFSVYASQFEGWTTNCRSRSVELLPLDDSVITCYLDKTCLSLQCCRESDVIGRSFYVRIDIDPCRYIMTFQIEKLIINTTLNDYEWGRWRQMDMYGVVRLRLDLLAFFNLCIECGKFFYISECPSKVNLFKNISSFATCRIPLKCTAIDCCITLPYFGRGVNFFIDLDMCDSRLMVGIEKIALNYSLLDYEWGKLQSLNLYGVFIVNYTIDDFSSENVVVFSVNVSICFESLEKCEFSIIVLKEARLPKPSCDLEKTFTIPDFSLRSYLTDIGLDGSVSLLPAHTISELLHRLDIAQFLLKDQCNQQELPFAPSKNGWNKGDE